MHSVAGDPATLRAVRLEHREKGEQTGGRRFSIATFRRPGRTDQCLFHVPLNLQIFKRSFYNEASIDLIDKAVAEAGHPIDGGANGRTCGLALCRGWPFKGGTQKTRAYPVAARSKGDRKGKKKSARSKGGRCTGDGLPQLATLRFRIIRYWLRTTRARSGTVTPSAGRWTMRRREFIGLLGSAAAWPLAARAQQSAVGVLISYALDQSGQRLMAAFREGLKETGYEGGRNVEIDYRSAEGQYDRLPRLAADLVQRGVSVIAALGGSPAALAAKSATTSIPIVFQIGLDPVQIGLVQTLGRPGGNVTGITNLAAEVGPKRLEVLHSLVPAGSVMAVLVNPNNPGVEAQLSDLYAAARMLGREVQVVKASTEREIETAIASLASARAGGLVINGDPFFNSRSEQLATQALRHAVPAIYQFREFTAAGGLISYGSSLTDAHRLAGVYAGRVLKGEKPADLPVQQPPRRTGHQPQDRAGARPRNTADTARPRRRGHRMRRREVITLLGGAAAGRSRRARSRPRG